MLLGNGMQFLVSESRSDRAHTIGLSSSTRTIFKPINVIDYYLSLFVALD